MISGCEIFIQKAESILPDPCTSKDLVDMGLYKSEQAACYARKMGLSPDYFKLPHKAILYPKAGVVEFLKKAMHLQA